MRKIILLNGPAGCGKDTLAALCQTKWGGTLERMSAPLKSAYLQLCPGADLSSRKHKEAHRANLISLSEEYVKPRWGKGHFGNLLAGRLQSGITWVSDSRFKEEAIPLTIIGADLCVIRIRRGGGAWPAHDSGHYLNLEGVRSYNVHNNSLPETMIERLERAGFEDWLLDRDLDSPGSSP